MKQSGFIPGDSTVYQLSRLYHSFAEALDQQKDIRVVFCDISKAFDRVWHNGLLHKLSCSGIKGNLHVWLTSYLSDRKQRVVIDGQKSDWLNISAGVPQGSVLGPLLFLVYINDIASVVQSEIHLFADDTIIYVAVDNPATAADALNSDLDKMLILANQWLVNFSPPKTVSMNISKKRNKHVKPQLSMGGSPLTEKRAHKHLGVTLTDDLSWSEHIETIAINAGKCLDIFNALKLKISRYSLEKLYFAYVRPKLEYAAIVWDGCPQYLVDLLENVQLRAARIISGAISHTSHALIYKELGWESLADRRRTQRLITMYKTLNNLTPAYMSDTIPPLTQNHYQLPNADNIPNINARTNLLQRSFFPQSILTGIIWMKNITSAPSLPIFKRRP